MVRMLGTLGRMTLQPTLLEPFSDTLTLDEARACQRKQLTVHHVLELETKARGPFPWLWMLSVGQPSTVIRDWRLRESPRWPRGVYRSSEGMAVGVVVLRELPPSPETLTLRLFGDERIRKGVEAEVAALPEGSPYRLGVREVFWIWELWLTGGARRKDMDFGQMNQIIEQEEQRRARENIGLGELKEGPEDAQPGHRPARLLAHARPGGAGRRLHGPGDAGALARPGRHRRDRRRRAALTQACQGSDRG